jgi:hypothetical protein
MLWPAQLADSRRLSEEVRSCYKVSFEMWLKLEHFRGRRSGRCDQQVSIYAGQITCGGLASPLVIFQGVPLRTLSRVS